MSIESEEYLASDEYKEVKVESGVMDEMCDAYDKWIRWNLNKISEKRGHYSFFMLKDVCSRLVLPMVCSYVDVLSDHKEIRKVKDRRFKRVLRATARFFENVEISEFRKKNAIVDIVGNIAEGMIKYNMEQFGVSEGDNLIESHPNAKVFTKGFSGIDGLLLV